MGKYKNDEDYGDWKMHSKKDDELDKKDTCPKCGKKKGSCPDCTCKKTVKESKFEKYLVEAEADAKTLTEETDMILEKLGSLDAMDASELFVPANVALDSKALIAGFKKSGLSLDAYINKMKKILVGASSNEIENIRLTIASPVARGGDMWGKSDRLKDTR